MALEDYRKKRDFSKTPEPKGTARAGRAPSRPRKKPAPLFFCVQKHMASHLHYDLRLEWNGVLMSWAIPKGPSLDPSLKRFAAHVEDHPREYGTFEGVIPEGYGAGIVMLWDEGTWVPEVDDVDAALAKGDLKFSLDGYKLKGSWVLVRTRGYSRQGKERAPHEAYGKTDGKSWLLIKHRDFWSGDLDVTTFAPLSVKSGEDFPAILAADPPLAWTKTLPVSGGETGAMLRDIIEQAAQLRAAAARAPKRAPRRKK